VEPSCRPSHPASQVASLMTGKVQASDGVAPCVVARVVNTGIPLSSGEHAHASEQANAQQRSTFVADENRPRKEGIAVVKDDRPPQSVRDGAHTAAEAEFREAMTVLVRWMPGLPVAVSCEVLCLRSCTSAWNRPVSARSVHKCLSRNRALY
jgi:hypothetical protein